MDERSLIRPAVPADAGVLATLAREAYSTYTVRIGREPAPIGADYAAAIATGRVWVAEDRAAVVGMIVLEDAGDHLLLENVAVLPRAQGRGVGSRLLRTAETIAAERGLRQIRLYTNEAMTENLGFYQRQGYVETHRVEQEGYHRVFFAKSVPPLARPAE
jgi:ribosomal protein S18 acetylase RimI-like enzyme